ncbi:MAG: DNA primase, partial [Rhodobiaceae bacterium]|nr:DNA primase [Rhodobiaceae bacterium]
NDQKGFYHCFSSGNHGDIFRFLMETEGLGFGEAVERLAAEAGVPMPARDPRAEERERERDDLYAVMDAAVAFFRQALETPQGARARGYLSDRGLSAGVQSAFSVGYAPDSRNALRGHLEKQGISSEAMIKAGLLIHGDDIPVAYDRFRDRIIFPITDMRGRTIAFGGRALSPDVPAKYLNSPETELFHKGHVLYNAHMARKAVHDGAPLIVAEGYMDVIALASAGFRGAVAPLGTALTEDQMRLLWRFADEPILCFDGDKAGLRAAYRAIDLALPVLAPGKSLRFALLPEGMDPDDLIRREGADAMRAVLERAQPLIDLLWMKEYEASDWTTPERRAAFEARIGEVVRQIGHDAVRRHYRDAMDARLAALSGRSGDRRGSDRRQPRGNGRGPQRPVRVMSPLAETINSRRARPSATRVSEREAVIILGILNHPELIDRHAETLAHLDFRDRDVAQLRDAAIDARASEEPGDLRHCVARRGAGEGLSVVEAAVTHGGYWWLAKDASVEDAEYAWMQIVGLHHREVTLHRELKEAERALNEDWTEESFERLKDINAQIRSLAGTEALHDEFGARSGRGRKSG